MAGESSRWIRVCSLAEAPSEACGRAVKIGRLNLAVFNWNQTYYALENFCPHQGFPLTEGMVHDGAVICGWHGWRVALHDGTCGGRTAATSYRCEIRGADLYVEAPVEET